MYFHYCISGRITGRKFNFYAGAAQQQDHTMPASDVYDYARDPRQTTVWQAHLSLSKAGKGWSHLSWSKLFNRSLLELDQQGCLNPPSQTQRDSDHKCLLLGASLSPLIQTLAAAVATVGATAYVTADATATLTLHSRHSSFYL
jgi:hypothetical protein